MNVECKEITVDPKMKSIELFENGYNCAQAVICSFTLETGMSIEDSLKIASSFGGGMGRLREVCGAVSGMFMVAGILYGYTDVNDKNAKDKHYKLVQEMAEKFKAVTGSIICREILNKPVGADSYISEERTKDYYAKRPCVRCVGLAAKIMEETIKDCS